jgi:hypothetical protein
MAESNRMAKFTLPQPGAKPAPADLSVDTAALNAFAAGARARRGAEEAPPWEPFDPKSKPRHNVSLRLNDYHMTMLHYLAASLDMSQHKILSKQLLPVLQRMASEAFNAQQGKSD